MTPPTSNERTHDIPDFERWMLQLAWYHGVGCTVRLPLAQCSCGLHGLISRIRQERTDRLAGETGCSRCKEHEMFRHQHRDCDRLAIALHHIKLGPPLTMNNDEVAAWAASVATEAFALKTLTEGPL